MYNHGHNPSYLYKDSSVIKNNLLRRDSIDIKSKNFFFLYNYIIIKFVFVKD